MAAANIRLHLDLNSYQTEIEVDGKRLGGVRSLTLGASVDEIPTLKLELVAFVVDVDGPAKAEVDEVSREALLALGWTPPAEQVGD